MCGDQNIEVSDQSNMDDFSSLETVLKEIVSKTHQESEPVRDTETTASSYESYELSEDQLVWNFDVVWRIDEVNVDAIKWGSTRTKQSVCQFGDKYMVMSVHHSEDIDSRLQIFELDDDSPLRSAILKLRSMGLKITTGRWIIPGRPLGIVMDIDSASWAYDRYKYELHASQGIVIPNDIQSRDVLLYGYMAAQFLADYKYELDCSSHCFRHRLSKIAANFHGAATLVGLILLRDWRVPSETVFISREPDSMPDYALTPATDIATEKTVPLFYRGILKSN